MTKSVTIGLTCTFLMMACRTAASNPTAASSPSKSSPETAEPRRLVLNKSDLEARKKQLSPEQFNVTQECGTEPAFHNAYWDNHAAGLYVDVVSGEPLFSSLDKFDSGTGWPSFSRPLDPANVVAKDDTAYGMVRTEVRSKGGDSHLGHVFPDGPKPGGQRFCINSASLRFVPAERLSLEGYESFAKLFPQIQQQAKPVAAAATDWPATALAAAQKNRVGIAANLEVAVVGGGCFWGMQHLLRRLPGVIKTDVGYAGGAVDTGHYEVVTSGKTGHAESVRIVFDPKLVTYEKVLLYFFNIHDPTTLNRQHNDVGTQYRSVIFAQSAEQARIAQATKERVDRSKKLQGPVVTQIVPAIEYVLAENYHQDYLVQKPDGYNCHIFRGLDL